MIEILKYIFLIIGTFVGAGFASGKEIYIFFYKHGIYGVLGIILSGIFMGITMYKTIKISKEGNVRNYQELLKKVIKNNSIRLILENVINIFLIASFGIMVCGFCGFFWQEFRINTLYSYAIIIFIFIYYLGRGDDKIIKISNALTPIIIVSVLYFFIIKFKWNSVFNITTGDNGGNVSFALSSILYANYNLLCLIPIAIAIGQKVKNEKNIIHICCISISLIVILSICIFFILAGSSADILELDMPTIAEIGKNNLKFKYFYSFIIAFSIITTTLSIGYGYLQRFIGNKGEYFKRMCTLILSTLICMPFGFSNLILILYPIFGCIGLVQSFCIGQWDEELGE